MNRYSVKIVLMVAGLILAVFLNLLLHEAGHSLFAVITGNEIETVSFGTESYTVVKVVNEWANPIISLGSFILPASIFIVVFLFFKKQTLPNLVIMPIGVMLSIGIIMNAIALFMEDIDVQMWDIPLFVQYTDLNYILVGIISLLIGIIVLAIAFARYVKVILDWI